MMPDVPQPSKGPLDELSEAGQPWWSRFSPHGEFPWSSGVSLGLHVFIILLGVAAPTPFIKRDPTPPAVDVICIGDEPDAAPGEGPDLPADDTLEEASAEESPDMPEEKPSEEVVKVEEPTPSEMEPEPADTGTEAAVEAATEASQAQAALDRVSRARKQLAKNLDKKGGGGGGGSGATGRGARVARWILKFNTSSAQNYLVQLDGLGATIAFPVKGGKFRYFYNASSSSRRSEVRDLSSESRLYWMDDRAQSVQRVTQFLKISAADCMVSFLPLELEERMLKLELAFKNLEENEIRSTTFEAVQRGGKYDVIVSQQIPR